MFTLYVGFKNLTPYLQKYHIQAWEGLSIIICMLITETGAT